MNSSQNTSAPFWKQSESRRLEFKEKFPKGTQVARTAIAFANGAGGRIVFGVRDDPRQVVGIPDDELFPLEERISNHIFCQCAPTIIPEIYIQAVEGKKLFKDLKLIEAWGTRIQKMRNEVRDYPEIELVLQETGHAFQVLFRKNEPTGAKLAPSTGQVGEQVAEQAEIEKKINDKHYLKHIEKLFQTATGQVAGQVTGQVAAQVLSVCRTPKKASEIQDLLGLKHRKTFMKNYLKPLLASGWIESTIPEKPKSRLQKYRIAEKGLGVLAM